jgi:hypothetical protein
MRHSTLIASVAFVALLGAGAGTPSDPVLPASELPLGVLNDCAALTVSNRAGHCAEQGYQIRWLGRTPRGHLFLAEHEQCSRLGCRTWLVEKEARRTHALLAIVGEFRLERTGAAYPVVQTRSVGAASYTSYNRYDWHGQQYARSETRLTHRVDNFECGSAQECEAAAQQALVHENADRAVKIWQQVHNIDWI